MRRRTPWVEPPPPWRKARFFRFVEDPYAHRFCWGVPQGWLRMCLGRWLVTEKAVPQVMWCRRMGGRRVGCACGWPGCLNPMRTGDCRYRSAWLARLLDYEKAVPPQVVVNR